MTTVDDVNNAIVGAIGRATQARSEMNAIFASAPGGVAKEMIAQSDWTAHLEEYMASMVEATSPRVYRFPEGVRRLPKRVAWSSLILEVEIPASVETIEGYAFELTGAQQKKITIKGVPSEIGEHAFTIDKASVDVYAPAMTMAQFRGYPNYPFGMWNAYGEIRVHCSDGSFVV